MTHPALLNAEQVAARLGTGVAQARRAMATGYLPVVRLSETRLAVPAAALEEWLRTAGGWAPQHPAKLAALRVKRRSALRVVRKREPERSPTPAERRLLGRT